MYRVPCLGSICPPKLLKFGRTVNIWQNNPKKTFVFSCVCDRVFWQSSAHDLRYADSTGHVSNEEEEEVLTGGGLEAVSVGGMFCSFYLFIDDFVIVVVGSYIIHKLH